MHTPHDTPLRTFCQARILRVSRAPPLDERSLGQADDDMGVVGRRGVGRSDQDRGRGDAANVVLGDANDLVGDTILVF